MKRIAEDEGVLLQSFGIYRRRTATRGTTTQHRLVKESPAQQRLLALDLECKTWKRGFARDLSDAPWVRAIAGGDGETLRKVIAPAKRHFQLLTRLQSVVVRKLGAMDCGAITFGAARRALSTSLDACTAGV